MGDSIPCYGSFLVDFFQVFIYSKWDSSNVGLKSDPQVVVNLCVCMCVCYCPWVRGVCPNYEVVESQPRTETPT